MKYTIRDKIDFMSTRGERIKQRREFLGISQLDLATACGWKSKSRISMYERDAREPSNRDAEKIAKALQVTASWLDYGDNVPIDSSAKQSVYLLPIISLSDVIKWPSCMENAMEKKETVPMCTKGYEECYAIKITNDLMKPEVCAGEFVIVDPKQKPKDGKLVIAYKQGSEEAMLKKYVIDGPSLSLRSNQDPEKINIDETIKIFGVVVLIQPSPRVPV